MPNNFVREGNLDDDFVVDGTKMKVRTVSVLTGLGNPTDPPSVPEKPWVYFDITDDVAVVGYVWEVETEAWLPFGIPPSEPVRRDVLLIPTLPTTAVAVGDGQIYFTVPSSLNGFNLSGAAASLPGAASISGAVTVQVARVRAGVAVDMLSTAVTIDEGETSSYTAATPAVVNALNDDVQTGDFLRVDVDGAGTGAQGLQVLLAFQEV